MASSDPPALLVDTGSPDYKRKKNQDALEILNAQVSFNRDIDGVRKLPESVDGDFKEDIVVVLPELLEDSASFVTRYSCVPAPSSTSISPF